MHIVLTGATGYIGSAVLAELIAAGHTVVAPVRSQASADAATAAGATAVIGDLRDIPWVSGLLAAADAGIHTAADADAASLNDAVIGAALDAFTGTAKRWIHTGGIWSWGDNRAITEDAPVAPPAISVFRPISEARLLAADVAATVIAPGVVYGDGGGLAGVVTGAGRDADGRLELIGSGGQHWAVVHVADVARLYVAAVERSEGGVYIGATHENPTVRALAASAAGGADAVVATTPDAARARLGVDFADALLLDQAAVTTKAIDELGWAPTGPTFVADIAGAASRPDPT